MNIKSIKNRANELLVYSKPQFIRILLIMLVVGLVPSLFSGEQGILAVISLIISVIFFPFDHGYIVSSLKIVRNNYLTLKDDDAWVGFSRFKELFPTYLIMNLIIFAIVFCISFIMGFVLLLFYGTALSYLPSALAYGDSNALLQILLASPTFVFGILLFVVVIAVIGYILSIYFFAVPYLLEQYHMETTTAIKESVQFIKGHAIDLFKLDLSYFGWFILVGIIETILNQLLGFIPVIGTLIATVLAGLVAVYTYLPQYQLSKTIFFEEIAYQRYGVQTQQQDIFDTGDDFTQGE